MITYLLFILVFLVVANHLSLASLSSTFESKRKKKVQFIENQALYDNVKRKTGLDLHRIAVIQSDKLFGMMPSTPMKPYLVLSSAIMDKFNEDELEWVVLHEAGHCVLWHVVKLAIIQVLFLGFGLYLLQNQLVIFGILLGIFFAILYVQCARFTEYEADKFAISLVDNPQGVITAQEKLARAYKIKPDSTMRKIFYNQVPISQRISMAQARIESHQTS